MMMREHNMTEKELHKWMDDEKNLEDVVTESFGPNGEGFNLENPIPHTQNAMAHTFARARIEVKKFWVDSMNAEGAMIGWLPNHTVTQYHDPLKVHRVGKEQWIADHIPLLSFGKLRGSYGTTGSDQIPDYGYLDTYEPTRGPNGLYPTQLTNRDYSWEINKKLEIGTELSFVNGIYNLGVSYYRNRSTNQLVGYPLPSITGFTSVQANLPAVVQNTGWEFEMDISPVTSKNFKWQLAANLTIPKNELLQFDNIDQTSYNQRFVVGQPLSIQRFYNYVGIDQETGLYQVEDVNGDGSYSFADQSVIVDFGRKFYGGINNTISFKVFI